MIALNNILAAIQGNIESVLAIMIAGSAIIQHTGNLSIKRKLSDTDVTQNDKIKQLSDKIDLQSEKIYLVEKYIKKSDFRMLIRHAIEYEVNQIILTYGLENSFASMAVEGSQRASDFFINIYEHGLQNVDKKIIEINAITILRSIRSQYSGNTNISKERANSIKNEVAYPMLKELLIDIQKFKDNRYNGSTEKEYIKCAVSFVSNFIVKSLATM